jgi:hypothetical protein
MTVPAALYGILSADAAVAALISDRVYPKTAPQGTPRPYLVFHKTFRRPLQTLTGSSLSRGLWQLDAWADDPDEAGAVGAAVEAVLDGFGGDAGGRSLRIMLDNDSDDYEPDTSLYRQSLDFVIWDCGPAIT